MSNHDAYRMWLFGGRDLTGRWHEPFGRDIARDERGMEVVVTTPCPVCGAEWRFHRFPSGLSRYMCVHSAGRHRRAGVSWLWGDTTDCYARDEHGNTVYRLSQAATPTTGGETDGSETG